MSISRFVGCQSCNVADRNSPYWLAFSAIAAGTAGMFSTTRLSPGLSTAGWVGGAPCAMSGEAAMKMDANKIAERRDAERENTRLTNPPRSGAEKPNRAVRYRQEE